MTAPRRPMKLAGRIFVFPAIVVIVAQSLGYKIFGAATVVENRPLLQGAQTVVRLEAPNIAVTERGDRIPVKGIVFRDEALRMESKALPRLFNELDPIRIMPDASQPSGVASERRWIYSRVQLFEPRFFPDRLPKYRLDDFGTFIRDHYLEAPSPFRPQEIPTAPDVVPSGNQGQGGGDP